MINFSFFKREKKISDYDLLNELYKAIHKNNFLTEYEVTVTQGKYFHKLAMFNGADVTVITMTNDKQTYGIQIFHADCYGVYINKNGNQYSNRLLINDETLLSILLDIEVAIGQPILMNLY
jgi:HKD family nuclease